MSTAGEPWLRYVFTWHCLSDACPKCQRLNGREWRDQDLFGDVLWDPFEGDVWDLTGDGSLAHPNCRCQLEVRVIIDYRQQTEFAQLAQRLDIAGDLGGPEECDVPQVHDMKQAVTELRQESNNATLTLRETEYVLYRVTGQLDKLGLPPDVKAAINQAQQLIFTVRMLHGALIALETGTTFGWIRAALNIVGTITTLSVMELQGR